MLFFSFSLRKILQHTIFEFNAAYSCQCLIFVYCKERDRNDNVNKHFIFIRLFHFISIFDLSVKRNTFFRLCNSFKNINLQILFLFLYTPHWKTDTTKKAHSSSACHYRLTFLLEHITKCDFFCFCCTISFFIILFFDYRKKCIAIYGVCKSKFL